MSENAKACGTCDNKLAAKTRALRESVVVVPYGQEPANVPIAFTSRDVMANISPEALMAAPVGESLIAPASANMDAVPAVAMSKQVAARIPVAFRGHKPKSPVATASIMPAPLREMLTPRQSQHYHLGPNGPELAVFNEGEGRPDQLYMTETHLRYEAWKDDPLLGGPPVATKGPPKEPVDPILPFAAKTNTNISNVQYRGAVPPFGTTLACSECAYYYTTTTTEDGPHSVSRGSISGAFDSEPTQQDLDDLRKGLEKGFERKSDLYHGIQQGIAKVIADLSDTPSADDQAAMDQAVAAASKKIRCPAECPNKIVERAGYRRAVHTRFADEALDGIAKVALTTVEKNGTWIVYFNIMIVLVITWRVGFVVCCYREGEEPERQF